MCYDIVEGNTKKTCADVAQEGKRNEHLQGGAGCAERF